MRRIYSHFRILFMAGLLLLALGGIVTRLWYVQIAKYEEYKKKTASGSRATVRIPAVRGEILDRNGLPLVENSFSLDVDFYLPDMVKAYRKANGSTPKISDNIRVHGMIRNAEVSDIEKIVRESIIPRMEELGVAADYNSSKLKVHYKINKEVPFNYRKNLKFDEVAIFSERNLGLPGVNVSLKPIRHYVYGALGAHFLGYVSMPSDLTKLSDIRDFNYYDPDMEGRAQVELYLDKYLKGTAGTRILQLNAKGVTEGEAGFKEPTQGANVYLTIDARIQYFAEKALRNVGRAAAVVIDPNNGDVLAMASVPSYDPNKFIPSPSPKDWAALINDDTDPMLNRATSAYAPGSTYKIPIGLAGLRAGVGDRSFYCSGGVTYGDKFMKCWIADKGGSHGSENLSGAIKVSCNAFFYQYGNAAGIDQIVAVGNMLGLGQKAGVPLSGESPGVLPGPAFLAQISPNERWSSGYTANTSIGQGMVLATPLQMASIAATVANGGTSYYPRFIDKIVAQDGTVLEEETMRVRVRSDLIKDGGLTPAQIEKVRDGMRRVVNEGGGTAGKARIKGMEVAGKTGTAQFTRNGIKDNHTWFIAFAPYDKPKYAICVLVQGAKSGGGVAAPIAAKILEDAFALETDPNPQLAWLEPAKGNFDFVESVDFGRDIPAATSVTPDEETSAAAASEGQENRPAAPNVSDEADERGKVKNKERKPSVFQKLFNVFGGGKKDKKAPAGSGR